MGRSGGGNAQGTIKQGLQRQKEAYSGKWRDLEERARGLDDALRSARQAVAEREEQNAGLNAQARPPIHGYLPAMAYKADVCQACLCSAAPWSRHFSTMQAQCQRCRPSYAVYSMRAAVHTHT